MELNATPNSAETICFAYIFLRMETRANYNSVVKFEFFIIVLTLTSSGTIVKSQYIKVGLDDAMNQY